MFKRNPVTKDINNIIRFILGSVASIISEKKSGREVFFGIVMKFQHFKELVQFSKSPVQLEMRRNNEKIESIKDGSVDLVEGLVHKKKSGG